MYQDERKLDFKPLGIAIKKAREATGWTQEYLAQLVDLTPRSIMDLLSLIHISMASFFNFSGRIFSIKISIKKNFQHLAWGHLIFFKHAVCFIKASQIHLLHKLTQQSHAVIIWDDDV